MLMLDIKTKCAEKQSGVLCLYWISLKPQCGHDVSPDSHFKLPSFG